MVLLTSCSSVDTSLNTNSTTLTAEETNAEERLSLDQVELPSNLDRLKKLSDYEKATKSKMKNLYYSANQKRKKTDYTKIFLSVLKYSGTEWSFYACDSKTAKRKQLLEKHILNTRILCLESIEEDRGKVKINYSAKLLTKDNREIDMSSSLKFHSKDGFCEQEYKYHFLFPYKNIGRRNGAYMNVMFPFRELNIKSQSHYRVEKMYWLESDDSCYVKLKNHKNGDLLYLKSENDRKIDLSEDWDDMEGELPDFIREQDGDSRLKKFLYYAGAGIEFSAILGCSAFFVVEPIFAAMAVAATIISTLLAASSCDRDDILNADKKKLERKVKYPKKPKVPRNS